jgi:phosphatidylglycerophosphate synthase
MSEEINRRPIATRGAWWAKSLASTFVRAGVTPNQVSVASVVFAFVGAIMFSFSTEVSPLLAICCFIGAACCIQLRLICNLLDGMIAIEGGKRTKLGALFNEFPDRIADSLFLVSAGYAALSGQLGIVLGWAAALLAVLTAYVRVFGAAQGLRDDFCGPMAKQHRMAVLTVASLLAAAENAFSWPHKVMTGALLLIVIGAAFTCVRRTWRIAKALESTPD